MGRGQGIVTPDKAQVQLDGELIAPGEFYLFMATTLPRLFARLRPFWGTGPGAVRFSALSADAHGFFREVPRIVRGRPGPRVTEDNGYLSRNTRRADLRFDCGFTVDGEQCDPLTGRTVSITADHEVRFVRA
jgi:hypothetical protein